MAPAGAGPHIAGAGPLPDGALVRAAAESGPAHDASACPVCFALSQARGALAHAPLARALEGFACARPLPVDPVRTASPAPELTSAAPRAPPQPVLPPIA